MNWLPEKKKNNFLIVDFWENFEHFNMMPKDDEGARQIPILVSIFNNRLKKLEILIGDQSGEDFQRIVKDLRADVARIPLDSFTVKKELKNIRDAWEDEYWKYLNLQKIEFLRMKVAPLLRFVANVNLPEAFFMSKMERCGLFMLQKKDITTTRESVKEDVALLPTNLPQIMEMGALIHSMIGGTWWEHITLKTIDEAKTSLAPLMKYKKQEHFEPFELDLQDLIESRKWIIVKKGGQKFMVEEYKKRVEEKIEQLASKHPTILRLKKGEGVTLDDLLKLEQTLETELGSDEITLNEDNMFKGWGLRVGSLTDFLKHILKLETLPSYEDVVRKAFDAHIGKHNYNADQTRFLRTVQSVFIQKRKLELDDLYEPPFSNFGVNAVEKLFSDDEVNELIQLTRKLVA